jgi:hypothetical protein
MGSTGTTELSEARNEACFSIAHDDDDDDDDDDDEDEELFSTFSD